MDYARSLGRIGTYYSGVSKGFRVNIYKKEKQQDFERYIDDLLDLYLSKYPMNFYIICVINLNRQY